MNINRTIDIHHVCFEIFVFNEECSLWTIASYYLKPTTKFHQCHHHRDLLSSITATIWIGLSCVLSVLLSCMSYFSQKVFGKKIVLANNRHLRHFVHYVWQYVLYPLRGKNNEILSWNYDVISHLWDPGSFILHQSLDLSRSCVRFLFSSLLVISHKS